MSNLDELKAEWFEFGRGAGLREAEERIIKLLETNLAKINEAFSAGFDLVENKAHTFGYIKAYEAVIALIKGEK